MSVVERLESSLAFLKANEWGQSADRTELLDGSVAYCGRGAVALGGFADLTDTTWCLSYAHWHKGPCVEGESYCDVDEMVEVPEFNQTMKVLDNIADEVSDRPYEVQFTSYNDIWANSKDDILAVFEKAIERARANENV